MTINDLIEIFHSSKMDIREEYRDNFGNVFACIGYTFDPALTVHGCRPFLEKALQEDISSEIIEKLSRPYMLPKYFVGVLETLPLEIRKKDVKEEKRC